MDKPTLPSHRSFGWGRSSWMLALAVLTELSWRTARWSGSRVALRNTEKPHGSSTKRLPIRLLPTLATALAVVVACELVLRAVGFNWLQWYWPDPQLGWALRPGLSGWFSGEGRSFVQVNSAGQRDREHTVDKPENVYRIAVLGDAYSEAMQVALEDSYWAQLPKRLESCAFRPGKRIEVLNFGVRDYGTAQAYLVLERAAVRYRPDLVLLQFSNGNDVRDNHYALDGIRGRPYFRRHTDGRLELDDSFASEQQYVSRASYQRELLTKVVDHSRVLQLARRVGIQLRDRVQVQDTENEAARDSHALSHPRDARWEEAWRVTEALIARIGEVASRNGASAAVVAVPFPFAVHPDVAERERLQAKYGVAHLTYPDRRVVSFARQNGMHGIMLEPEMQAVAAATRSYLYGFENLGLGWGHWNELGHRTAADIIARALCANPNWPGKNP